MNDEIAQLYPFSGRFLTIGNERMHYLDEGAGEPVLMVHGNPTWSFFYRNLILGLRGRGFRCIAPDHIGCGFSTKPQKYPYRLARHIDNLEALVEHLRLGQERVTLVLHDWGGAIGMGLAARRPEMIKRILLLNTAAFCSKRIPWRINICRVPGFGALAIRGFNGFARPATFMATTRPGGLPADVARGYLLPYRNWHDRIANLRFVQDIPLAPGHPSYSVLAGIEEKLAGFRDRPVMICWGGKDFCFNDHFLARWKEIFPEAAVHRFADAGHYVLEDAGEKVLSLALDFLGGGTSGRAS